MGVTGCRIGSEAAHPPRLDCRVHLCLGTAQQQVRQPGEVHSHRPRLVLGEQFRGRAPTGHLLVIEIRECRTSIPSAGYKARDRAAGVGGGRAPARGRQASRGPACARSAGEGECAAAGDRMERAPGAAGAASVLADDRRRGSCSALASVGPPRVLHQPIGRPAAARSASRYNGDRPHPGAVLPGVPASRAVRRARETVADEHQRRDPWGTCAPNARRIRCLKT
jgi:hypothetical protein